MGKENGNGNKKKFPLKLIVIIGAVLLLAGGGLAGLLVLGGAKKPAGHVAGNGKATLDVPGDLLYEMEIFVVNLSDPGGKRYLKTKISLEYTGAELTDELKLRQPQLRDVVLLLLSSKTLEEIQGTEGKIILRRELVLRINQVLQKGKVRNLYFTEFVIQ